jgi:type IV pilus assembly protein PilV
MMNARTLSDCGRNSKGLTLIEVMVALLVLSIGLVGIAALHLNSLRNAHSAYYSSIASSIALDFEERLWLSVAELGSTDCVDQDDADGIAAALADLWTGTGFNPDNGVPMVIPGLQVIAGDIVPGPDEYSWTEVPLTVRWEDERFTDQNQAGFEQFNFTARVVCYNPDPDDDDDEDDD